MKKAVAIVGILIGFVLLPGCITDKIEENKNDEVENSQNYVWEDDGELVIVTYDVTGLTDSMLSEFTNQTGYEINLMKLDDAGSILDHLMQYKDNQIADLAIGLDNTYLQTAIDNGVLWEHFANFTNISDSALIPYNGPLAVPFDQGYICLNYDSDVVDGEDIGTN